MRNSHHKFSQNFFRPGRMIFANTGVNKKDDPLEIVSSERQKTRVAELEAKADDPKQPAWLRKNAKAIAKKIRTGMIHPDLATDLLDNYGNSSYAENEQFQQFFELLANLQTGKLKQRGEGLFDIIAVASGQKKATAKQKQAAREVLKKYRNNSNGGVWELSDKELEADLAKIANPDNLQLTPIKLSEKVRSVTETATRQADTNEQMRQAVKMQEELDGIDPKDLELLRQTDHAVLAISTDINTLRRKAMEIDQLEDNARPNVPRLRQLYKEYGQPAELNKAIEELEAKKLALIKEAEPAAEAYKNLELRQVARMRAKRELAQEIGLPYFIKGAKFTSELGEIELVDMEHIFDPEVALDDSPGIALIRYNLNGKEVSPAPGPLTFIRMLKTNSGFPVVKSAEELNEFVGFESAHKELEAGAIFRSDTLDQEFKITAIDSVNKQVVLDRKVTSLYWSELPQSSTPEEQKVNHNSNKLSFGEFARLVRSKGYVRKDLTATDVNTAIQKNFAQVKKHCEQQGEALNADAQKVFNHSNQAPKYNFDAPALSQTKTVLYLSGANVYKAELTAINDKDGNLNYHVKAVNFEPRDIETLGKAGLPQRYLAAKQPGRKIKGGEMVIDSKGKPHERRGFSATELINMAKNGDIVNFPASLNGQSSQLIDGTDRFAAATAAAEAARTATQAIPSEGKVLDFKLNRDGKPLNNELEEGEKFDIEAAEEAADVPTDEDKPNEEGGLIAPTTAEIYKDATVSYDEAAKVGKMNIEEEGYLTALWSNTRVFSLNDFWAMGKTMWEYYDRRWQRRQKGKYSSVGQELPFFSPEMKRINQSAENEEVGQFQETLDQFGVLQIQDRLRLTNNKDEMKAAFIAMTNKGQMRWDDVQMWKNLNQFLDGDHKIPIPANGDPYTIFSDDPGDPRYRRDGLSYMKAALDSLWGEGTYDDWSKNNKSTYSSNAKSFEEEGKALEGVEGGHIRVLSQLLADHRRGEFVDPHRYEGLILQAIDNGKTSMQAKLFYMIMGVAVTNSDGRTIMPFDRIAHINSNYLPRFPILQYFCDSAPRGDGKAYRMTLADYKKWAKIFEDGDPDRIEPGVAVDKFLWDNVIPSNSNRQRINKAIRNAETIDHDDFFAYLPPATVQTVTDACGSQSGAGKKFLTTEGYKNVFPGFSQLMKTLASQNNAQKLTEAINSYIRFESIMMDRYEKGDKSFQRLDGPMIKSPCVASSTHPIVFMHEMNSVIDQVVAAYSDTPEGQILADLYAQSRVVVSDEIAKEPEGQKEQNKVNAALKRLPDATTAAIQSDGGRKLLTIFKQNEAKMTGMPFESPREKARRKAELQAEEEAA